ncbi:MAG: GNAT family N-acetyltransferase [Sphingomonadaceae bacterium]
MQVRPAIPTDAERMSRVLAEIIAVTGKDRAHDPASVLSRYITYPTRVACSVAVDEHGDILGFQSLKKAEVGNSYDTPVGWGIIGTHIRPSAHRRGVGKALFAQSKAAAVVAGLPKIDAYIGADSPAALAYYDAMGFVTYRETETIIRKAFDCDLP